MVRPSIKIEMEKEGGKDREMERQYMNQGISELKNLRAKYCQRTGERKREGTFSI